MVMDENPPDDRRTLLPSLTSKREVKPFEEDEELADDWKLIIHKNLEKFKNEIIVQ